MGLAAVKMISSPRLALRKLATLPRFAISLLAAFDENARELREMLYQFERDFVMDSSRFEAVFDERPTALDEGVRQTLNWYRNRPPS